MTGLKNFSIWQELDASRSLLLPAKWVCPDLQGQGWWLRPLRVLLRNSQEKNPSYKKKLLRWMNIEPISSQRQLSAYLADHGEV